MTFGALINSLVTHTKNTKMEEPKISKGVEILRELALSFRVYSKSLLFICFIITIAFVYIILNNKNIESFSLQVIIISRMIIFTLIFSFFYFAKKREFIYYRNLGLSKFQLLRNITLIDFVMSNTIMIIAYVI